MHGLAFNVVSPAKHRTDLVDLGEVAFEEGQLVVGHVAHDGCVLRDDRVEAGGGDAQQPGVGVAQQVAGGSGQTEAERLPAQVVHLAQQQQQARVKVHAHRRQTLLVRVVEVVGDLGQGDTA